MTGCGCLLLVAALIALIAVFIFGSTDPGEPVASMQRLAQALAAVAISWAVARASPSRARRPARS